MGADTLAYLSLDALQEIGRSMKHGFCDACFSGNYPVLTDPGSAAAQRLLFEEPDLATDAGNPDAETS